MKYGDRVELLNLTKDYEKEGAEVGMCGMITLPEMRNDCFEVLFPPKKDDLYGEDIEIWAKPDDLKVIQESTYTDDIILKDLPKQNPKWWCKVENGYIKNLLGEKKNKIPYDYNS